jgi:methylene-fatty-acyl-phospholipid synthase
VGPWLWIFLAAGLLSLERVWYACVWRAPDAFKAWCARSALGEPVDVMRLSFFGFKILQCSVFLAWCLIHGDGSLLPLGGNALSLAAGTGLVVAGQILNVSVFYRLGKVGVFYGNKLGYRVPWCRKFPFSCLRHPQYVGALLAIWGLFLIMRFPHDDWYLLPALETVYYTLSAYAER